MDARLNVYGVTNLKVAGLSGQPRCVHIYNAALVDMSIAPGNVGGNTNSTAIVIGEKAALLIAEDLGIKGF